MKTYFVAFRLVTAFSLAVFLSSTGTSATEPMPDPFAGLADEYRTLTRPLLQQFCLECHSTAKQEADLDLERFAALADVRRGTKAWLKVVEMLDNGEMPPAESKQPSPSSESNCAGGSNDTCMPNHWRARAIRAPSYCEG